MAGEEGLKPEKVETRVERLAHEAFEEGAHMRCLAAVLRIGCEECQRGWNDPGERWRAYRLPGEPLLFYCPGCAELEFGSTRPF